MENSKNIVIFMQLGTPKSPDVKEIKNYLKIFLTNKRVVEKQSLFWKIILNCLILPTRSKISAKRYQKIWDGENFLLKKNSSLFLKKIEKGLANSDIKSFLLYSFDQKILQEQLETIEVDNGIKWLIVPLFPQFCEASSGVLFDAFFDIFRKKRIIPSFEFLSSFHKQMFYTNSIIKHIDENLSKIKESDKIDSLLLSFHNMPIEQIERTKDPYLTQCRESFSLIRDGLKEIDKNSVKICFQSGFGRSKKITPIIEKLIVQKIKNGEKNIAVFCPGFLMDNLETTVEIDQELRALANSKKAKLHYIPCLNDIDFFCESFAEFLINRLQKG